MLTWEQWQEKSKSSLAASRILLENDKPVEAASRAYYAAYQMVTGVLIKLKLSPRAEFGNWSHEETRDMYRIHICQKAGLGYKERNALTKLRNDFWLLLINRRNADYGIDGNIDVSLARTMWRNSNRLFVLLQNLIERGVL
jgi:hypothetical protein